MERWGTTTEGSCWVPEVCWVVYGGVKVVCVGKPLVIVHPPLVWIRRVRPVKHVGQSKVVGFI